MGAVTLTENGKTVFEKAYGYADIATNTKATPATKYKIGSISKMFTATVIFKLIEDKKLTLDTRLSKFYPKVKNADKITISNLLSHSSGIFNYTDTEDFAEYMHSAQTKDQMVKRIAAFESEFEPGSKNEYSNSNYLLLGYIIEDITKKPYADAVNNMIVKKAGLKSVALYDTVDPKADEAYSFGFVRDWEKIDEWAQSAAYSAGGIQATTADLDTFITALFAGKLISKESLAKMMEIQHGYGRGIFQIPFHDKTFYGHNGHIEGFSSALAYNKEDGFAIALVTNGEGYGLNDVIIGVLSYNYGRDYKLPEFSNIVVDAKILQGYTGTYACPGFPMKVTIMYEHGEFLAQATGQGAFPLDVVSETEFKFDPAQIKMTFKDNTFTLEQAGHKNLFTKE